MNEFCRNKEGEVKLVLQHKEPQFEQAGFTPIF